MEKAYDMVQLRLMDFTMPSSDQDCVLPLRGKAYLIITYFLLQIRKNQTITEQTKKKKTRQKIISYVIVELSHLLKLNKNKHFFFVSNKNLTYVEQDI